MPDFIHVFEPAEGDDPTTALLLHGTGADERDLLGLGRMLAPGAALLSPRGQVSEHGAPRWFARHAEGVLDEDDLKLRVRQLADWVRDDALAANDRDPAGLVGVGFSNGANVIGAAAYLEPGWLRAGVLLAPMLPFRAETAPPLEDLTGSAYFIGAGRADLIAPPDQAEQLATILTDAGAAVTLHWHPGGHGVDRGTADAARGFLDDVRDGFRSNRT